MPLHCHAQALWTKWWGAGLVCSSREQCRDGLGLGRKRPETGVRTEASRSLQDPLPSPERGRPGARMGCPTPGMSLLPSKTDSPGDLAAVSSAWREVRPGLVFRGDYRPPPRKTSLSAPLPFPFTLRTALKSGGQAWSLRPRQVSAASEATQLTGPDVSPRRRLQALRFSLSLWGSCSKYSPQTPPLRSGTSRAHASSAQPSSGKRDDVPSKQQPGPPSRSVPSARPHSPSRERRSAAREVGRVSPA